MKHFLALLFLTGWCLSAQPIFGGGGKVAARIGPSGPTLPASCSGDGPLYQLTAVDGSNARGAYNCVNGAYVYMGGGSGSASSPYVVTFSNETTKTITAATHGLGTSPLDGGCFTADTLRAKVNASSWGRLADGEVTITMDPAWTGTCTLHAGSGYTGGGGDVSSVFGRTGAVVATTSDYAFSQISGTAAISQGGTGATTAAAARVALFPSMTGNALKRVRVNTGATDIEYVTSSYDLEGSATLSSWGTIGAGACVEKNLTLTGAVSGDKLVAGWPSTLEAGIMGMMIPGTDLAVVRLCNVTGSGVAVADGKTFAVGALR
ncbi:MAG: hypothetical protein ABFD89_02225 [Bryobacteraceae bacterium]